MQFWLQHRLALALVACGIDGGALFLDDNVEEPAGKKQLR